MKKNIVKRDKQEAGSICPVTGLPVYTRPEWINVKFGRKYKITYKLIGDGILLSIISGSANLQTIKEIQSFNDNIIKEMIPEGQGFILLSDLSEFKYTTREAQKYFTNYYANIKNMLGLVFYGASPLVKFSINFEKLVVTPKFNVEVFNNYNGAVIYAEKVLRNYKTKTQGIIPEGHLGSENNHICPISGFIIKTRPEWTDIRFGEDYRATVKILGDRIFLASASGSITLPTVKRVLSLSEEIIDEMIPSGQKYILIDDISGVKYMTREARKYLVNYLEYHNNTETIIFYGVSKLLKISINLVRYLKILKFDIKIASNYTDAIEYAMKVLANRENNISEPYNAQITDNKKYDGLEKSKISPVTGLPIYSKPEWIFQEGDFSLQFEVIHNNILHGVSAGYLEVKHIEPSFKLQEDTIKAMGLKGEPYIYILGLSNSKGANQKSRRLYISAIQKLYKKYPFNALIFYGVSRRLKAGIYLATPFVSFEVHVLENKDDALSFAFSYGLKKRLKNNPSSFSKEGVYKDELLHHLAKINWNEEKSSERKPGNSLHPYSTVFDAIDLIKWEFDDLLKERKQTMEELRRAKEAAESANIAKSEFLANMSHELRTPLNHIIGFTELVENGIAGDINPRQKEYLGDVLTSSKHLLSLINDILDISKIEAGKMVLETGKVDLKSVIKNSLKIIEGNVLKQNITIIENIEGIPHVIIADERKIRQILYNLLSNAVKFTLNGGTITIKAELIEENLDTVLPESQSIKISISDNGIGMSSEDCQRIFSPFEQVDGSVTRKFQGTGLGLAITKKFVNLHGGKIQVNSDGLNKGSVFTFTIPLVDKSISNKEII